MIKKQSKSNRELSGQISVRLSPELMEAVEKLAAADRRNNGQIARFAIEEYIERRKQQVAA